MEIFLSGFLFRRSEDDLLPTINGVEAIQYTKENCHPLQGLGFNTEYENINLKMTFTGNLWLNVKGRTFKKIVIIFLETKELS